MAIGCWLPSLEDNGDSLCCTRKKSSPSSFRGPGVLGEDDNSDSSILCIGVRYVEYIVLFSSSSVVRCRSGIEERDVIVLQILQGIV